MTREIKHSLTGTAAFAILPLLLLLKTTIALFGGPSSVQATIQPALMIDPSGAGAPQKRWTEQQRIAADHIEFLKDQPFGPSPLHRLAAPITPDQTPVVSQPNLPTVRVQMIMASVSGSVALIDGKPYRVGDSLGKTSWIIAAIDADALAVTCRHARTGETTVISVQTPE